MHTSITSAELVTHKNKKRIKLVFIYNKETINYLKQFDGKWSQTMKCWHIADTPENRALFSVVIDKIDLAIEKFKIWLQANRYSENTIRSYIDGVKIFLRGVENGENTTEITNENVITFMQQYAYSKNVSVSWQRLIINAIKLYFSTIENKKLQIDSLIRPRKDILLPNVLSKEEVTAIIKSTANIKHQCMLSVIYSCGLRRSELLKMKPEHIQSERGLLLIKAAKGRKDRVVPLSAKILELLRSYYKIHRPTTWLFEGQHKGEQYSERSLSEVLRQAATKAGIKKPVTLHWLRHSFATHLLESGVDIRYIQELLGHNSSKTTEIYTHVSRKAIGSIKSPFDDLNL